MRFRPADQSAPAPVGRGEGKNHAAALSAREQEVLEFITKGFSSNEIAALMSVSSHTVLTYVRRIYAKLEVKSRTEAIYEARHQGLLPK
jgi:DNA-binding NarL/FixJ family response regulator